MENFLNLSCGSWAVHVSRLDLVCSGYISNIQKEYHNCSAQEEYQVWINIASYGEGRRKAKKNSEELIETLMGSERKRKNSPELWDTGGARTKPGWFRLIQQPLSMQWQRSTAAAELGYWGDATWNTETKRQGGKVKGTPGPIYNVERISGIRRNRGGQKMDMRQHRRLNFWRFIKREDVLNFGLCVILMTGDVMAGYHSRRRWRHGGLQDLARINEEGFF